jgi:aminomethyltransferase
LAADATGMIDPTILGVAGDCLGEGLKALITAGGSGMGRLRAGLVRRGIDLCRAKSIRRFGAETPANTQAAFQVQRPGHLILAAPGAPMSPHDQ